MAQETEFTLCRQLYYHTLSPLTPFCTLRPRSSYPTNVEYDNMDLEMLQEVVPMLKQQLEKSMLDRNYVQLERVSCGSLVLRMHRDDTHRDALPSQLGFCVKRREDGK